MTVALDLIQAGQAQKEVTANRLFNSMAPAALFGVQSIVGFTLKLYGGSFNGNQLANSQLNLAPAATTYIEADAATGAISMNVSGFTPGRIPLYLIATDANGVTATTDYRQAIRTSNTVPAGTTATINVPAQFPDPQAALTAIKGWTVFGTVTIKAADGTYPPITDANHAYGHNIQIVGNTANPDACVIMGSNPATANGVSVTNGHVLGLLDGFRIDLPAKAAQPANYSGIYAGNAGTIICGQHMKVNNFYYSVNASYGSEIVANNIVTSNAGDVSIWAFCGSQIVARNAQVSGANDAANGYGFGIQAEYGSQIDCEGSSATGCYIAGIAALSNSQVRARNTISNGNVGSGYLARDGGSIEATGGTANTNTRYGIEIIGRGEVLGVGTLTTNTLGAVSSFASFDTSTGSPRIVASAGTLRLDTSDASSPAAFNNSNGLQVQIGDGGAGTKNYVSIRGGGAGNGYQPQFAASGADANISMRYDAKGTGSHFFNAGGGLQFSIDNVASAVNRFSALGAATGGGVRLQAAGSDANIPAIIASKGAALTQLFSNGVCALQVNNVSASAVNFGQIDGSITGSSVDYKARGADANIDLGLSPKGTGVVKFGTVTANADAPITGYILIKDSGGTTRKLAIIA